LSEDNSVKMTMSRTLKERRTADSFYCFRARWVVKNSHPVPLLMWLEVEISKTKILVGRSVCLSIYLSTISLPKQHPDVWL